MANRTRSTNQPKKTACEERGHLWMSTTASNFRYCDRSDCKRTERLDDNGTWVLVEKVSKQKQEPVSQAETLLTVWDACDHIGVACHGDTLPRTSLKDFWTQGATVVACKACGKPWQGTSCGFCGTTDMPVQEVQA